MSPEFVVFGDDDGSAAVDEGLDESGESVIEWRPESSVEDEDEEEDDEPVLLVFTGLLVVDDGLVVVPVGVVALLLPLLVDWWLIIDGLFVVDASVRVFDR